MLQSPIHAPKSELEDRVIMSRNLSGDSKKGLYSKMYSPIFSVLELLMVRKSDHRYFATSKG